MTSNQIHDLRVTGIAQTLQNAAKRYTTWSCSLSLQSIYHKWTSKDTAIASKPIAAEFQHRKTSDEEEVFQWRESIRGCFKRNLRARSMWPALWRHVHPALPSPQFLHSFVPQGIISTRLIFYWFPALQSKDHRAGCVVENNVDDMRSQLFYQHMEEWYWAHVWGSFLLLYVVRSFSEQAFPFSKPSCVLIQIDTHSGGW